MQFSLIYSSSRQPAGRTEPANTIACVELRRAILLFAVVLGVAAIVSSIARPPERGGDDSADSAAPAKQQETASATKQGNRTPQPVTVEFSAGAKPQTREIEVGQPATVLVDAAIRKSCATRGESSEIPGGSAQP